ncbi:MAG TPA: acetate kinase, partial [Thermosynergistes sp.]|nr:acetate kinase [Thermosynergistes sp.]
MKVLVLNCGSSSIKYQVFDMRTEGVLAKGLIERVGIEGSRIKHQNMRAEELKQDVSVPNHKVGVKLLLDLLVDETHGVLKTLDEIVAVGHRVVHGGEAFARSVIVNKEVLDAVEDCVPLAPLHNPANLMGIRAMMEILP